ncbi:small subunit ribosomal protein S17 [Constrictibacter sp. MBR-5]|uniref:30S ribosomal protein S17 n=1 Tax=Constrictibacter sp. MBR-5 TaxID=3156467 RepID=UPI003395D671
MPRRVMQGVVVSDVADKTVSVRVDRRVMHPIYKKFVTKSKKYLAHDENNAAKVGDKVRIEECRPLSKRKSWVVLDAAGSDGAGGA